MKNQEFFKLTEEYSKIAGQASDKTFKMIIWYQYVDSVTQLNNSAFETTFLALANCIHSKRELTPRIAAIINPAVEPIVNLSEPSEAEFGALQAILEDVLGSEREIFMAEVLACCLGLGRVIFPEQFESNEKELSFSA